MSNTMFSKKMVESVKVIARRIKANPQLAHTFPQLAHTFGMPSLGDIAYNGAVMDVLFEDYKAGKIQLTDEQLDRVATKYRNQIECFKKSTQA